MKGLLCVRERNMLVMTRICAKSATVIRMKCANLELIFSLRHVHLCFSFTASLYSQVLPAVSAIHLCAACTAGRGPDSLSGLTGAINCTRNSGGKKTNYKCDVRRRTRARVNLPEFPTWDPVPLHFSVSKVVFSPSTIGLHLDASRKYRFGTIRV